MLQEHDFYEKIGTVPELPPDMFEQIEKRISRKSVGRKILYVIAASIIVLIGSYTLTTNFFSRNNTLQPEVASELQIMHDYLNSSNLEEELSLYAVVEGY